MELKETESEGVSGEVGEDMEEWGVKSLKGDGISSVGL